MNGFTGFLVMLMGVITMVGSVLATRYSMITIIILSLLKITGIIEIPWFAGALTLGAISTGIWVLVLGIIFLIIGAFSTAAGQIMVEES